MVHSKKKWSDQGSLGGWYQESSSLREDANIQRSNLKTQVRQKAAVTSELRRDQEATVALGRLQGSNRMEPPWFKGSMGRKPTNTGQRNLNVLDVVVINTSLETDVGVTCNRCRKVGHFGAHCFWLSKLVQFLLYRKEPRKRFSRRSKFMVGGHPNQATIRVIQNGHWSCN